MMTTTAGGWLALLLAVSSLAGGESASRDALAPGHARLSHVYHSGFVVETRGHVLVFDYWPGGEDAPASGLVDPGELALRDVDVVVFVSHEHKDHWYPGVLEWRDQIERIHYVVSPEVSAAEPRLTAAEEWVTVTPHEADVEVGTMKIRTLRSTDSGVAFLVEVDGLTLYHSGDHAAWNWSGDEASAAVRAEEFDVSQPRVVAVGHPRDVQGDGGAPLHLDGGGGHVVDVEDPLSRLTVGEAPAAEEGVDADELAAL